MAIVQILAALTGLGAIAVSLYQAKTSKETTLAQIEATTEATRMQIQADVISVNRQEWINRVRSELSEMVAESVLFAASNGANLPVEVPAKEFDGDASLARVFRLRQSIVLSLNPNEPDHVSLISLVSDLADHLPNYNGHQVRTIVNEITANAQRVFKAAWERVKRGD